MNKRLQLAIVALGAGAFLLVLGCASTEDRQREARAAAFNQWLGQDKQSRVRQVGPPDNCTGAQAGEANSVNGAPTETRCGTAMTRTASRGTGHIPIGSWE